MADTMKKATCPICGYVESSTDATALESDMAEHMQTTHNMTWNGEADIKQTGNVQDDAFNSPLVPPSAAGGISNGPLH